MGILSKIKSRKTKTDIIREVDSTYNDLIKHYVREFNEGFTDALTHALAKKDDKERFAVLVDTLVGMKEYVEKEGIEGDLLKKILRRSNFIDAVVKICTGRKR